MLRLVFIVSSLLGLSHCFNLDGILGKKSSEFASNRFLSRGQWSEYSQPLDHFNSSNALRFDQQYFYTPALFGKNAPVLLVLGTQIDSRIQLIIPPLINLLPTAHVIYLEHRYYGKSVPELNVTITENLQWLTIEQTLADINDFVTFIRSDLVDNPDQRIILIGQRYAGSLATWYQLRYPGNVAGVLALSAPLLAQIDVPFYFEAVGEHIRRIGGNGCYERIDYGISHAESLFANRSFPQLEQEFAVCNASCDSCHVRILSMLVAQEFSPPAQAGRFVEVSTMCHLLNQHPKEVALSRVAQSTFEPSCIPMDLGWFELFFQLPGYREYAYQQCSGLGWIPNTSSPNQPFGGEMPLELFYDTCTALFGKSFNRQSINDGEQAINRLYGGLNPHVENVLFINGDNDPYRNLNVRESPNNNTCVINIPGYSEIGHSIFTADNWELNDALRQIQVTIKSFLNQ